MRFGSTESDFTKLYRDFLSCDVDLYHSYQEGYKSIRQLIDLESAYLFIYLQIRLIVLGGAKGEE